MAVGGLRDTSQFREGWVLAEVKLPQPWHNQVSRYAPSEHKQQQYFRVCHVAGGVKVSHAVWLRTASSFTLCPTSERLAPICKWLVERPANNRIASAASSESIRPQKAIVRSISEKPVLGKVYLSRSSGRSCGDQELRS